MTKILYSMIYPPDKGGSGAPIYTELLLRHMTKNDEKPGILSTVHKDYVPTPNLPYQIHPVHFSRPPLFDHQPSVPDSIPFSNLSGEEIRQYKYQIKIGYQEATRSNHYDVVHVQHGMYLGSVAAELGLPYIISLHVMELNFLEEFPDPIEAYVAMASAQRILALTQAQKKRLLEEYAPDRIISLHARHKKISSASAARDFASQTQSMSIRPELIDICPLGIDTKLYRQTDSHGAWKQHVEPDQKIVLFAGRLIELKGIQDLLDAENAYARPEIHTLIAGGGPLENDVRKAARSRPNMNYLGFIEQIEMPRLLSFVSKQGGVLANPTRSEGLSVVYLEAMACGVPVIASAKKDMGELDFMRPPNAKFVPFNDPPSLAQAITYTLNNLPSPGSVRACMIGYNVDRMCHQIRKVYRYVEQHNTC